MEPKTEPIEHLARLADKVDARFASILERQTAQMQCCAGCSACCRARLAITRVEEAFLRRGLKTLPEEQRAELSARTREKGREMCPALDADGRCGIYAFRPLICRSYGVPLRHRRDVELINPPVVDVCDLNFTATSLKSLQPGDIFDQTDLVEALKAIDREYCTGTDNPPDGRVSIIAILE